MSIKKKLFSNTISNGLQFGSRWLMNLLFAKSLSLSLFGTFSFIYSLATLMATFFTFGSNLYLLSKGNESKEKSLKLFIESLLISTLIFLISLVTYFIISNLFFFPIQYTDVLPLGFILAFIWSVNTNIFSFFKGIGLFDKEAKAYIFFSSILLLILAFIYFLKILENIELFSVFFLLIFINLIPTVIGLYYLKVVFPNFFVDIRKTVSKVNIIKTIKDRFSFGLHEIQSIFYANLPFIMLGIFVSAHELGIYRAIYILITPILILPNIISQVLLNQLAFNKGNSMYFKKIFRKFLYFSLSLGIVVLVIYLLVGPFIVKFLYNEKINHEISMQLLTAFTITAFLWFIKSNYEVLLTALNKQWLRVKVLLILTILYPFLVYVFPTDTAVLSFAYALLINTFLMLLVYTFFAEKILFTINK